MEKVYFKPVSSYGNTEEVSQAAAEVFQALLKDNAGILESFVPLKVHFGEKGNKTFIESKNFEGIIASLKERGSESAYIETNVLYRGERTTASKHKNLAESHGFTQLPILIADGEHGDAYETVEINKKHFKTCKIAKGLNDLQQVMILSHFKGHILAGFGGAVKQLAMGFASRGGKLAQHANAIPKIGYLKCKSCGACVAKCPENAVSISRKAKIDKNKCVGCAACMAVCPYGAISNSWISSLSKSFNERVAEYAYAAAKGKKHLYITFALNITRGCDCEGHPMKSVVQDVGVFASLDPVALDKACLDIVDQANGKIVFRRGRHTLEYAEKIGLGSRAYEFVEVK